MIKFKENGKRYPAKPLQKEVEPDRHTAAAILGSKGGKAGTGDAKRRSKKNIQKAVRARIEANRRRKLTREAALAP